MKILFVCRGSLRTLNRGTPLRMHAIYTELSKLANVALVCTEPPPNPATSCYIFPTFRRGRSFLQAIHFVNQVAKEFCPDVIYGHTHNALLITWLGNHKAKTCVDLHGLPYAEQGLQGVRKTLQDSWDRFLVSKIDGFTTVCNPLTDYYRSVNTNGQTLHGGVHNDRMSNVASTSLTKKEPVIAYIGNMRAYQGVHDLLNALQLCQSLPWHLLLICSSDEDVAKSELKKRNLDTRATVMSQMDQDTAFSYLKGADIAVVPRPDIPITRYAFASKLPEYLASGTAVVTTDVADAHLLVQDGVTGWLVSPGNHQALADALADALQNPIERQKRGDAAKQHVKQHFNWCTLVQHTYSFLQTL